MTTLATDPYCITDEDAAALLLDARWRRFAVLGDSMAAGIGDDVPGYPSGGWATTIARALQRVHPDAAYLNTGERDRYAAQVRERIRDLGDAVAELAERRGGIHIVMTHHPAAAERSTYSADLLHASARGHAIIAAATIRRLAQVAS